MASYPNSTSRAEQLPQQNIAGLYHFTELRNLKFIFENDALLSYAQIQANSIPVATGGDSVSLSLAQRKNLTDYISLSFTPYTPMSSNRKLDRHLCFLVFRHDVADINGVLFCNGNANANATIRAPGLTGAANVNLSAIKNGVAPGSGVWHDAARSEILVPQRLDLSYLEKVIFVNDLSRQQARDLCLNPDRFNFEIDENTFFIDPTVDRDIAFNTLISVDFDNCYFDGTNYLVDRTETNDIILKIKVRAAKKMKLLASTSCKTFRDEWSGMYPGEVEAIRTYPVDELSRDEYFFNVFLDGSFWRRRVVMVN
ncbi:hypothetical protein Dcae01_02872 [Deinococcus caeni]|uniref:DarT domain-containing protein n=1 Tax=Deinococcus caeni TaxID=569127 RepID=A0ABP9UF20_9DEIO